MSDICTCATEKLQLGSGVHPKARVTSEQPSTFVLLTYYEMHMDTVFFLESFARVKNKHSGHP